MIPTILVTLVTFLHLASSYNYCSVTPYHTLCGYTGGQHIKFRFDCSIYCVKLLVTNAGRFTLGACLRGTRDR